MSSYRSSVMNLCKAATTIGQAATPGDPRHQAQHKRKGQNIVEARQLKASAELQQALTMFARPLPQPTEETP